MAIPTLATFQYLAWQKLYEHEKPFKLLIDLPSHVKDQRRTNLIFQAHSKEIIHDARGTELSFSLDDHGFSFVKSATLVENFHDADEIRDRYFKEVEATIMQNVEDVERVVVFDWRRRVSMDEQEFIKQRINLSNPSDAILPAVYPHIDQTAASAVYRAKHHLPQEHENLLRGRFRIINVWRPLSLVENWPLALCDRRTVRHSDLVPTDYVTGDYVGETYFLKHSPKYKWHFLSAQQKEEVVLFKIYDSADPDEIGCPHASFSLGFDARLAERHSIEVRAFVFSKPA